MRFSHITELAEIEDDEALAAWLRGTLERMITAIERQQRFEVPLLVAATLKHIREHMEQDLGRDEVARHVGVSPGHLSNLLKERTGRPFVENCCGKPASSGPVNCSCKPGNRYQKSPSPVVFVIRVVSPMFSKTCAA
jgi:AraC-like DNA-binding protein